MFGSGTADSKAVFADYAKTVHVPNEFFEKMISFGWDTFANFAFATNSFTQPPPELFQKEVLDKLLGPDNDTHVAKPAIRRLFFMSYTIAAQEAASMAAPSSTPSKYHMNSIDREVELKRVAEEQKRNFKVEGHNCPSNLLVDFAYDVLKGPLVRIVPWEICTSIYDEVEDPKFREDPGLKLTSDGVFVQARHPGPSADLSGEMRWEGAMRRRGVAFDISGLCSFALHNEWVEVLKSYYQAPAKRGFSKINWDQLLEADQELFRFIQRRCGSRIGPALGESVSQFQKAWVLGMENQDVRQSLQPRYPTSSSSSAAAAAAAGPNSTALAIPGQPARARNQRP